LILMKLKLPTQSSSGFIYMGIIVLILIIVALTLLVRSLSKYRIRLSLLAFILVSFIPSMIVNTYQSTFAKGIYAIFYEIESSECDFELMDEYKLHGQCYLYFEN